MTGRGLSGKIGPAFLSAGFRPFFLAAALWAAFSMTAWILSLSGIDFLDPPYGMRAWHAHESLFGYLGAVMTGFLLTSVPSWTGMQPIRNWSLLTLLALWLAGRVVFAFPVPLPAAAIATIDLSGIVALAALLVPEVIRSRNWHNLPVLAILALFVTANGIYHWDSANGRDAASGTGLRLGVASVILMITFIGGRIVPAFTRNWLNDNGRPGALPATSITLQNLTLTFSALAMLSWVMASHSQLTSLLLMISGLALVARIIRWRGWLAWSEPLVWILHIGYSYVPIGMLAMFASIRWPDTFLQVQLQHLWMAGAIGTMTMAVMTRASLGHTGRALAADMKTTMLYLLVIASVICRLMVIPFPEATSLLLKLSAGGWIAAFVGFAIIYGPKLASPRLDATG